MLWLHLSFLAGSFKPLNKFQSLPETFFMLKFEASIWSIYMTFVQNWKKNQLLILHFTEIRFEKMRAKKNLKDRRWKKSALRVQ